MGFRPGQVQGLLQRKYHRVMPTGMSTSQLVADLLQEEDGGRVVGARGMFLSWAWPTSPSLFPLGTDAPAAPVVPGTQRPSPLHKRLDGQSLGGK